jgi:membrane protein
VLVDNNYYVAIKTSMYQENSMIKTITFAILHFSVAFSVAYILTGSIGVSSAVALVEPIVNTVVFYFHEKAWNRYEKNKSEKQKLWVPLHQCG